LSPIRLQFCAVEALSPTLKDSRHAMPVIVRSALVEHSAARMFALVNDVSAYPRRFDWCNAAEVLEESNDRLIARLDLGFGGFSIWFTTENILSPSHHIDMDLRDGPFKRLQGRWEFHGLDERSCKVSLKLDFEAQSRMLAPALALGMQGLADRMVDDFVREADQGRKP
jgi:ribosome-associated toxin RatA of RatAB toxin-antitoxin module